jgi:hypothetical protein
MKEKEVEQGTAVNQKEEELLQLVATLIVQIILKESDECDRLRADQQKGPVGVFPTGPGSEDQGILRP